jgi:hypothetical protein
MCFKKYYAALNELPGPGCKALFFFAMFPELLCVLPESMRFSYHNVLSAHKILQRDIVVKGNFLASRFRCLRWSSRKRDKS